MRKTLGVCLLILLLTGSANAGIMPNLSPAPPPSQTTNAVREPMDDTTLNGEMHTPGIMHTPGVSDALAQSALDLLALLPLLL